MYFNSYVDLIEKNSISEIRGKLTNTHHILPKAYFKLKGIPTDNSNENLVILLYKDHIIAHYYLCLCTIGKLKQSQIFAFFNLVNRRWSYKNFNPKQDLELYQELDKLHREQLSKTNKGRQRSESFKNKCRVRMLGAKFPSSSEKKKIKIICIETQEIFNSLQEASQWLDSDVSPALKHYSNQETVKGYHWAYLDDLETQTKLKKFIGKHPCKRYYCKVLCVELNLLFNSVVEAKQWLNTNNKKGDISGCIRGKQRTAGGYHWKRVLNDSTVKVIKNNQGVSYICEE